MKRRQHVPAPARDVSDEEKRARLHGAPAVTPLHDRIWAAGLFEGEGTVTIAVRNRDDTYRLLVTISNTDEQLLDFFLERWGGSRQPAYGERPRRKPAWYWSITGGRAETFLLEVEPHLQTDRVRRKFEIAKRFRAHQAPAGGGNRTPGYKAYQRQLYEEMRVLNRRGVAA